MICPFCKAEINEAVLSCPECGEDLRDVIQIRNEIKAGKRCVNCQVKITIFNEAYPLWEETDSRFCAKCRKKLERFLNQQKLTLGETTQFSSDISHDFLEDNRDNLKKLGFSELSINYLLRFSEAKTKALEEYKAQEKKEKEREELFSKCLKCGKPLQAFHKGKIVLADGVLCGDCFESLGFLVPNALMSKLYSTKTGDLTFKQVTEFGQENLKNKEIAANFNPTYSPAPYAMFNDEIQKMILSSKVHREYSPDNYVAFDYSQIVDFSLLEDGNSIASGGLGRAVVGGLLFGGAGAIVGGVTRGYKSTCTNLQIKITVKDYREPAFFITLISSQTAKSSFTYKEFMKQAESILSKLQLIIDLQSKQEQNSSAQATPDIPDQIRKYKSLLEDGIITTEEFEQKKRELLNL